MLVSHTCCVTLFNKEAITFLWVEGWKGLLKSPTTMADILLLLLEQQKWQTIALEGLYDVAQKIMSFASFFLRVLLVIWGLTSWCRLEFPLLMPLRHRTCCHPLPPCLLPCLPPQITLIVNSWTWLSSQAHQFLRLFQPCTAVSSPLHGRCLQTTSVMKQLRSPSRPQNPTSLTISPPLPHLHSWPPQPQPWRRRIWPSFPPCLLAKRVLQLRTITTWMNCPWWPCAVPARSLVWLWHPWQQHPTPPLYILQKSGRLRLKERLVC